MLRIVLTVVWMFVLALCVLEVDSVSYADEDAKSVGQNWPQWRGPASGGISAESGLPVTWSSDEQVIWKALPAGLGGSSPIVWGEMVFLTSQSGKTPVRGGSHPFLARDDPSLVAQENPMGGRTASSEDDPVLIIEAFDLSDGSQIWDYRIRAKGPFSQLHEKHNLATPTPVTDGMHVYAWFGNGQVVCLDMKGNEVWTRHLGEDYAPFLNRWGHGSSPMLYKDLLILLCDHDAASYLLALDKKTGQERWKVDRGDDRISHSTPVVVPGPEGDELVINSSKRVDAFDPTNGRLLWHMGSYRQTPIPTPVFHDGVMYMARGYRNSDVLAIGPGGRGEIAEDHILWRVPGGASYVPSIIYYEGLVYMTNEVGVVTCVDARDGKRVWRKRLGGIFYASPVAGDGKVYLFSETGETFVLKAGREGEVLARNVLEERFIASPAISSRRILLRGDRTLFCIGE